MSSQNQAVSHVTRIDEAFKEMQADDFYVKFLEKHPEIKPLFAKAQAALHELFEALEAVRVSEKPKRPTR